MVNSQLSAAAARWPEIDGLRAVAIISVLLFHLGVPGFSMGWAGVNLFFVISGFLITGILLDTRESPRFFRNFYIRRSLRIFPIYYLAFVAILAWNVMRGRDVTDAGYYALYLQNFVLGAGHWHSGFPGYFVHTWSLAVEEQFYWLWPLVVWRASPRQMAWMLALFFAAALVWRCYAKLALLESAWFTTTLLSQLDGLSAGAALALFVRSQMSATLPRRLAPSLLAASIVGLALFIWLVGYEALWQPQTWVPVSGSPFVYSALAVASTAFLSLAIQGAPVLSATLRLPLLRHVGTISYGLYLYHYPAFAAVDTIAQRIPVDKAATVLDIAKLGITYLIALASWHWLERPILSWKERWAKREPGLVAEGSR